MLFVIPTAGEVPIIQAMLALGHGGRACGRVADDAAAGQRCRRLRWSARSFRPQTLLIVAAAVVVFGIVAGLIAVGLKL